MKHHYTRLLLTTLITTTTLAATITNATANRLSISNRNIRITWSELELHNNATQEVFKCPVTLEGSFENATIRKVLSALIGFVSRASVNSGACTNGHATVHTETLPWRLTYQGFTGTLPRITAIKLLLIRFTFEFEFFGNTCTAETEELHPANYIANLNESTGVVENLEPEPNARIPLRNGRNGALCGLAEGSFTGRGVLTLLGNTSRITIALI